ncbi:hypothetical protein B0I37DRAFT_157091 [Chaetomium sp. MPI-CAGE-AT-0009]|nr:hypothetical protein B0I37DRAFT_157091 [Chaetomium sp. MPI-CAGE-AT-0009]
MDPLFIAAHAAALKVSCDETIGSTSAVLNAGTPDQDSVLSGLGYDLQFVGPVVAEMHRVWAANGSAMMVHPAAGFGMWPSVQKNLESARASFQAIKTQLEPVLGSIGKSSGFLGRNKAAWKLGMRIRTLAVYRERLRAHQLAFKVSVDMMRM